MTCLLTGRCDTIALIEAKPLKHLALSNRFTFGPSSSAALSVECSARIGNFRSPRLRNTPSGLAW